MSIGTDERPATSKARTNWLDQRRKGIGGSDAPAILGVSPWKSPLDVWAEKRGLIDDVIEETEAMRMGHRLERIVAAEYADRHPEAKVVNPGARKLTRHPQYSFLFATLDRVIEGETPGVLEIKTTSERLADRWEDGAPLMYEVQLQHEMMVSGLTWGVLAVLIGGREYREFRYDLNPKFTDRLLAKELEFWGCVLKGEEPTVDPTPMVASTLAKLHPDDNGQATTLTDNFFAIDDRLVEVKKQIKALDEEREQLEAKIKVAIGENTFGVIPGVAQYSWKTQEMPERILKPSKFRRLTRKNLMK